MKNTKKALLLSAMALLLCCTMLVGTTFAWFTDSVTSGNNIIAAGNLDVELDYYDGSKWASVQDTTDLFSTQKWEPGHAEVVYLRLSNKGTLALNYSFTVSISETEGTNVSGNTFKLSDYIYMGVVNNTSFATRAEAIAAAQAGEHGIIGEGFAKTGSMQPASDTNTAVEYLTLVVYMPESVGNDANYLTGTTAPSIDLGVTLLATQVDSESDSFGNDYDAGLSPLEEGEVMIEKGGAQYVATPEGMTYLYLVPEDYADATFAVAPGTNALGNYSFAYNDNVQTVTLPESVASLGRAFDSSTVKKVVLNEGLTQIDSRAFRSTTALEEVVISSTVEVIADNAFQKSGIKSITIPATVETIGETAFGSSKIETVIIEGNTAIQGFAFRGCTQLRTVYLNGDDVTFIPSTLNGRNSMWFCNGESNNPNTSNITFYVKNETVAARLRAALGAENPETTPIYVNGVLYQP